MMPFARAAKIAELAQLIEKEDQSGDIDDLVHELHSSKAASINNEGFMAQAEFLVQHYGEEEAEKTIRDLVGQSK